MLYCSVAWKQLLAGELSDYPNTAEDAEFVTNKWYRRLHVTLEGAFKIRCEPIPGGLSECVMFDCL
jgi:hypothetical protein